MKISETAVRRPVATAMVFLALTLMGGFAFQRLGVDLFPELDFPSISVVATYEGVGPEEMETLMTEPLESAIALVEGISKIESFSAEGRARVALRFEWGVDLETAANDVRAAIDRVRGGLPEEAEPPVVYKFNLTNLPVLQLGLEAPGMTEGQLRRFADDIVKPWLERTVGVAGVDVRGARSREIHVDLNVATLASKGITTAQVVSALRRENVTVPAGNVADGRENVLIRAMGEFRDLEDIRDAPVAQRGATVVRVRDVAQVRDAFEEYTNIVRVNSERGVQLRVTKSPDANTVEVADRLYESMAGFNEAYAGRASMEVLVDNSTFIRRSIEDVQTSVLYGAALAFLVLLLFLRSLRTTLVIAVAIPISVVSTFLLMYQLELTLNLITFGGVALGLGMLVDNAIVILENIFRRREAGDGAKEAAIRGSREVGGAIVASTLTTLAVFAPVVFLGGFAAVFFRQMALVVSSALLCSLFVALTLVPVLTTVFLRRQEKAGRVSSLLGRAFDRLDDGYGWVVKLALRWAWLVVAIAVGVLVYAWGFRGQIGQELLPESDESQVRIMADYPPGTRIEVTEAAVATIEAIVREHAPEVQDIQATVGTPGFWSTDGEESARLMVTLSGVDERERSSEEVARALAPHFKEQLPGMRVISRPGGGLWIFNFIRGGDARVRIEILGHALAVSDRLGQAVLEIVSGVEGVSDAKLSREAGGREKRFYIDQARASDLGLSTADVAEAISTLTQGARAGVYREQGDEFNIRARLDEAALEDIDQVLAAPITLPTGRDVMLRDLVRIEDGRTPLAIDRLNQERILVVEGGVDGTRDLGSINAEIQSKLDALAVPEGFSVRVAGEGAEQQSSFASLGMGVLLAALLVYMIMAGQFESFFQPLIIMVAVPFAAIGVIATLVWTETTLNINSFMGIIVLVGVVVNNAIVLVDYINLMRREGGLELRAAIIESARRRLRPILMTTATTVLALLPVALGDGSQTPLARVVVGGMLSSTLVSLVLVPVLYLWLARAQGWLMARRARREQVVA